MPLKECRSCQEVVGTDAPEEGGSVQSRWATPQFTKWVTVSWQGPQFMSFL